jgi:AraC-like DNA-binding protein
MIRPARNMIRVTAPAGTTTSITSGVLVALLDGLGQPPDDLLDAAGVSRAQLAEPDAALPLATCHALWARAHALVPDIGLTLVERFAPGQMHLLLHLAMRSETVGEALADACRHATVTSAADAMTLVPQGKLARFAYAQRGTPNPWLVEHYFGMTARFIAQATGQPLPIRTLSFVAPRQAPEDAYVARFGVVPCFGADANVMAFDAEALAWPLQSRDAYLHAILERVAQARAAPPTDDFAERVRNAIAQQMLAGEVPTQPRVATACGLGERALRDRLAKHALNFRTVLDQVRRDLARDHLARGLSVGDTAALLGFSEPAAFQHACRRWFGEAAGQLRKRLRPG